MYSTLEIDFVIFLIALGLKTSDTMELPFDDNKFD
jgi:hypothetical protein